MLASSGDTMPPNEQRIIGERTLITWLGMVPGP